MYLDETEQHNIADVDELANNSTLLTDIIIIAALITDIETALLIQSTVPLKIFNGAAKDIVQELYKYISEYKKCPAFFIFKDIIQSLKDQTPFQKEDLDFLEKEIKQIVESEESLNYSYIKKRIVDFVRTKQLNYAILEAAVFLKTNQTEKAREVLLKWLNKEIPVFEKGLTLSQWKSVINDVKETSNFFYLGIEALDKRFIVPAAKELFVIAGATGVGKSWALTHCGKMALMQGKKVLHVTLELSQEKTLTRYVQAFCSVHKENLESKIFTKLSKKGEAFLEFDSQNIIELQKERSLFAKEGQDLITNVLQKFNKNRDKLIVKEFPTNYLTLEGLKNYIELLQKTNFYFDVLIIDYADLMKVQQDTLRLSLSNLYANLRGIAAEYEIPVITATQLNKEGANSSLATELHLAESWGKAASADKVITLNQTAAEEMLGLCRLYVAKNRDSAAKMTVLLNQFIVQGQFVIDSAILPQNTSYFKKIEGGQ